MLKRKVFAVALMSLLATLACSTASQKDSAQTYPDRTTASIIHYQKTEPGSGQTFWQEYTETKKTSTDRDLLGRRLKVVFKWVRANPISMFEDLRKYKPILSMRSIPIKDFDGENKATVLVTLQKDVKEVLDNPAIFSIRDYTKKMDTSVGPFMLGRDNTPLNNVEKPWMRSMMPATDKPGIRRLVKKLTLEAINSGTFAALTPDGKTYGRLEVVNSVARRVPLKLTGEYFGFPGPNIETMARWSKTTQADFFHNVINDPQVTADAKQSGREMQLYIRDRVSKLGHNPSGSDVLSRLLRGGVNPNEIVNFTDERIGTNILGTLIGGVETTEAAIVQSMEQLFARPHELAGAIAAAKSDNDDLLAKYVWEALRFNPVNPFVVRYAEQDYVLGKGTTHVTKIAKGSLVLVGTQSAMFDESYVKDPMKFKLDRDPSIYYHLGYGMHRCLGDMVSEIQVPEIIKQLLLKENIRPASGFDGQVNKDVDAGPKRKEIDRFTAWLAGQNPSLNEAKPEVRGEFPEKFVVEYDGVTPLGPNQVQVAAKDYAFEDYLMAFDRADYRSCLAGTGILSNLFEHFEKDWRQALLLCRLKPAFRACIKSESIARKFDIRDQKSLSHAAAFEKCNQVAPLTRVERDFYGQVMLGRELDLTKVPTTQAVRNSGPKYEFEDILKFYDRYNYRETFMSPAAPSSFPEDREMIFYARLPFKFRYCLGPKVLVYKATDKILGEDRAAAFNECKDGLYAKDIGRYEGGLSDAEKYYYRTLVLGENIRYGDNP